VPPSRLPALALIGASLAAIGLATLGPVSITGAGPELPMLCLLCGNAGTMDFTLNVVLFVPLGLSLALWHRNRHPAPAALAILTLSLVIETLQATVIAGRHAALSDLVANTLGGILGLSIPGWWRGVLLPAPRRAARLALAAFSLALAVPAATVYLLRPAPGATETWYGQWAHLLGGTVPFEGEVLDVRLDSLPVTRWRLPVQEPYRATWRAPLRFSARIVTGLVVDGRAQVAAIADGTGGFVAAIWQDGPDAVMSLRLRTSDVRLRTPWVRLEDALTAPPGTETTLAIEVLPDRVHATAERTDGLRATGYRLSPSLAWVLWWPFDTAFARPPDTRTALWLVGWFALIQGLVFWWCRLAGRPGLGGILAAGVLAAALLVIPLVAGMSPAPLREWAAAGLGTAAGLAIASWPPAPRGPARGAASGTAG
jgi:hypothetical protein